MITSVSDDDIKYLKTSNNINDMLTSYILLNEKQLSFFDNNSNATYLEVYNCMLFNNDNISIPIINDASPNNEDTLSFKDLVRKFIAEKYSIEDEIAIINNFTYQANESNYAEEYGVYQLYRLECKQKAKSIMDQEC